MIFKTLNMTEFKVYNFKVCIELFVHVLTPPPPQAQLKSRKGPEFQG